jgi:SAM-dependent methyltransferase
VLSQIRRHLKKHFFTPRHPLDKALGIETTRFVGRRRSATGNEELDKNNVGYGCAQPSVVRASIERIPNVDGRTFMDIGCGKGRVLAVGTEFPFKETVGYDIVPELVERTNANGKIIASRFPSRPPLRATLADAMDCGNWPDGDLAMFLYNSFRAPLVEKFAKAIEEWDARHPDRSLYLIYCNPVHFHIFDASPSLERFATDLVHYTAEERTSLHADNVSDTFIIYRVKRAGDVPQLPGHDREVRVTVPDLGADMVV